MLNKEQQVIQNRNAHIVDNGTGYLECPIDELIICEHCGSALGCR